MIKKLAWNTFKNTGNINTFLELIEVENVEKSLQNGISNCVDTNFIDKTKNDTSKFSDTKVNSNFNNIANIQNKNNN